MQTVNFNIKQTDDNYWFYLQKSPGDLEKGDPLHSVLTWIIEQLVFAMFRLETDNEGNAYTMVIGERASRSFPSMEEAEKHAADRLLRVNIAGVFAKAREEGTQPEYVDLVETTTVTRTRWAELRTEFHYAQELVKMLRRLRDVTYDLSPPGVLGRAPEEVLFYLRQATRCFMYGLFEASVAICRACLDEALKKSLHSSKEGIRALMKEPKKTVKGTARGELDILISAAAEAEILDGPRKESARRIQNLGNTVMHDRPLLSEDQASRGLDDLRAVVDFLFAS
jgi:hypothetical protein